MKKFINKANKAEPLTKQRGPLTVANFNKSFREYFTEVISLANNIKGDFVEFGFGGTAASSSSRLITDLMKSNYITKRKCWFYDSFEGLPSANKEDLGIEWTSKDAKDKIIKELLHGGMFKPTPATLELIDQLKKDPELNVEFVKGWYQTTAKQHKEKIAVLHLDGDLYESYLYPLTHVYPLVEKGGIIIFDDYDKSKWPGCTKAVNEFFKDKIKDIVTYEGGYMTRHYLIKK